MKSSLNKLGFITILSINCVKSKRKCFQPYKVYYLQWDIW